MGQNNELHADLASFLFNCARKNAFFGGFVQKYYFFWGSCRNNTFLGVRAEILLFFLAQFNKKLAKSACNSLFCLIFHGLRKHSRDIGQIQIVNRDGRVTCNDT